MVSFRAFLIFYVSTSVTLSFSPPAFRPSPPIVCGGVNQVFECQPAVRRLASVLEMVPGEPADLTANVTELALRVERLESIMSELCSNQTHLECILTDLKWRIEHLESNHTDLKRRVEHLESNHTDLRRCVEQAARVESSYLEPIIIFDMEWLAYLVKSAWNAVKGLTGLRFKAK
jgi:hypothetical protein